MIRVGLVVAMVICVGACQSATVGVEATPVREPAPKHEPKPVAEKRQRLPGWALEELPEDAPKERSMHEAKRLACTRLNIIRHANCLTKLRKLYDAGKEVDSAQCKLNTTEGCTP